ncbi:nuclear transport factor 2 family protein [Subtercola endophyticus]|uniref:nuclear transport factor 2 family protein n=1 Tax=Subtercola endophyticus TaxID=2895559 RepID=UPI001E4B1AC6|nr:nuclear transport factor 2 family protein [Subtercola endophyticus]UFS58045.1 hypothetical protein LQ955_13605 [Subtercola endophyticus]
MLEKADVETWVAGYLTAWTTCAPADIAALFTVDAEQHERPYETDWIGCEAIIAGWQFRAKWQEGGWTFTWELLKIAGDTFVLSGTGVYTELGTFDNLWVVTLDDDGKCTSFQMWNNEI